MNIEIDDVKQFWAWYRNEYCMPHIDQKKAKDMGDVAKLEAKLKAARKQRNNAQTKLWFAKKKIEKLEKYRELTDLERTTSLLKGANGKRLTYYQ